MERNDSERQAMEPSAEGGWRTSTRKEFLRAGGVFAGGGALAFAMSRPARAEASPLPQLTGEHTYTNSGNRDLMMVNVRSYGASGSDYQTTGSVAAGSKRLTVKSAGDFAAGEGIYIAEAGSHGTALVTTVTAVSLNVITLHDAAATSVSNSTVQHDDTTAIMDAFKALGSPPQGRLGFPEGLYRISSTLDFGLGHPHAIENYAAISPGQGWFELDMVGRIYPVPGIGRALHVHSGYFPVLRVKIDHGGQWGDYGLAVEDVLGAEIKGVYAEGFAGTVLYILEQSPSDPNDRVAISSLETLLTLGCGQALLIEGNGGAGFGRFGYVWDGASVHGSAIRNAHDISLHHWENYAPASQDVSLDFQNCSGIHNGVIALGDSASVLMRIQDCFGFSIDRFFGLGGQLTGGVTGSVGLEIIDSVVSIPDAFSENIETAIYVKGSSVSINNHEAHGNVNHLRIGASATSTVARADVQALYGDANWPDGGSVQEDIVIDPDLTGGYLQLGGNTRNTNRSNTSGMYAVHCHSPAFDIYTWAFKQEKSNVAGGIGHPDPTGHVILAGGAIDNGVKQTS